MKLSEIKKHLVSANAVKFQLSSGAYVSEHFHFTEIGLVTKHFVDCGGTERLKNLQTFSYGIQMILNTG